MLDPNLLIKAFQAVEKGQKYASATIVEATLKGTPRKSGAKMLVFEDGSNYGTIGGGRNEKAAIAECLKAIKSGKTNLVTYDYFGEKGQSVCGGQMKVFTEPFTTPKHLIICGAGHIALPLSLIGKLLNYNITIIDNRKEFANKERFAHVDKILVGKSHTVLLSKLKFNQNTHVMIVTQGNEFDYQCLKFAIQTKAGYIGCISSKAKRIKFFNRLKDEGFSAKLFKKISIPAGIDLGGETPAEIAVSITAELIKLNNLEHLGTAKFEEKEKES